MRGNRVLKWALYVSSFRTEEMSPGVRRVNGDQQREMHLSEALEWLDGQTPEAPGRLWCLMEVLKNQRT